MSQVESNAEVRTEEAQGEVEAAPTPPQKGRIRVPYRNLDDVHTILLEIWERFAYFDGQLQGVNATTRWHTEGSDADPAEVSKWSLSAIEGTIESAREHLADMRADLHRCIDTLAVMGRGEREAARVA